ncbi:MAG TPA: AAA family ATPase [Candidatus Cloacimonetes bacterium]|nr:AAA family ATPase [Candidatus Cloacimonadota bacterium]
MKKQYENLGLNKIFDEIKLPAAFLSSAMKHKLYRQSMDREEILFAYQRRGRFMQLLASDKHDRWESILSYINELRPSAYRAARLGLSQLFELKNFVYHYEILRKHAAESSLEFYDLPDLGELFSLLDPDDIKAPSFSISPAYSKDLQGFVDEKVLLAHSLKHERHSFLSEAKEKLGMDSLKEEFVLPRSQGDLIQKIQSSGYFALHRENIANLSFILADSPKARELKERIARLNELLEQEEERILEELSEAVDGFYPLLQKAYDETCELGYDYALARFALLHDCCIPQIAEKMEFKAARNLETELNLKENKRKFQSLDMTFDLGVNLITGPNMGGKSTILMALGQFAVMIKLGIPLPAQKATMPIYDYVYYNHCAAEENLSSFGIEVVAFGRALSSKGRGLYLLDEFGKGTNPREGEALATAVIEYLSKSEHSTIAATHFTAPALKKGIPQYQIKGIDKAIAPLETEDLKHRLKLLSDAMDYSLVKLDESKSPPLDALKIARILGLPDEIITLAEKEL